MGHVHEARDPRQIRRNIQLFRTLADVDYGAGDRTGDWWLFQHLANGSREERIELERGQSQRAQAAWLARRHVESVIAEAGEPAIDLLLKLLAVAPDPSGSVAVGAGPLEDLINEHGDTVVDVVDRTARQHPEFAECLRSVYVEDGAIAPDTAARLAHWLAKG